MLAPYGVALPVGFHPLTLLSFFPFLGLFWNADLWMIAPRRHYRLDGP